MPPPRPSGTGSQHLGARAAEAVGFGGFFAVSLAAFKFIGERLAAGKPVHEHEAAQHIRDGFARERLEYPDGPIVAVNGHAADPHYEPSADHPADQPVKVPQGSLVLARVTGGGGTPSLEAGDQTGPFEAVDSTNFQVQKPVTGGTRIAVTQGGRTLGSWPIEVVPDRAPIIAHANPPAAGERGALKLDYAARDDYGLTEVKAQIRLAPEVPPRSALSNPWRLRYGSRPRLG